MSLPVPLAFMCEYFQDDTSGDYRKILLTLTGSQQFIK